MSETAISARQRQALREAGRTRIGPGVARALVVVFLVTVSAVPLVRVVADRRAAAVGGDASAWPLAELPAAVGEALGTWRRQGFFAANHELLVAIDAAETRLEESSWLRRRLLPPVQSLLTGVLGLGNEQAYPGERGWLFYRADVDHVVGRGFLEPAVLEARARGGDAWTAPPAPDPLPALEDLRRRLAFHGVRLLLMPTPVKPTIHPEHFAARYPDPGRAARNPSWPELLRRLEAAGLEVFDPAAPLMAAKAASEAAADAVRDGALYLRTDTHWTPAAMETVVAELAARVGDELGAAAAPSPWLERPVVVEGLGDVAAMLRLPDAQRFYAPERVTVRMVLDRSGRVWRPDPAAEVLVLGDSFTNVFSDAGLGWGSGGGLAERLAYRLGRPVDRIAQNAGGALAARQALARAVATDPGRLAAKALVVYQFATRELSQGDWRPLDSE